MNNRLLAVSAFAASMAGFEASALDDIPESQEALREKARAARIIDVTPEELLRACPPKPDANLRLTAERMEAITENTQRNLRAALIMTRDEAQRCDHEEKGMARQSAGKLFEEVKRVVGTEALRGFEERLSDVKRTTVVTDPKKLEEGIQALAALNAELDDKVTSLNSLFDKDGNPAFPYEANSGNCKETVMRRDVQIVFDGLASKGFECVPGVVENVLEKHVLEGGTNEVRPLGGFAGMLGKTGGRVSNVFGPGGLGTGINNRLGGLRGDEIGEYPRAAKPKPAASVERFFALFQVVQSRFEDLKIRARTDLTKYRDAIAKFD